MSDKPGFVAGSCSAGPPVENASIRTGTTNCEVCRPGDSRGDFQSKYTIQQKDRPRTPLTGTDMQLFCPLPIRSKEASRHFCGFSKLVCKAPKQHRSAKAKGSDVGLLPKTLQTGRPVWYTITSIQIVPLAN